MKKARYLLFKLFNVTYIGVAIACFFKNEFILSLLGSAAMYNIAHESITKFSIKKTKTEVAQMVRNNGHYERKRIWPVYIIAFLFVFLGALQNFQIFRFSPVANLILSIAISIYLLYCNEQSFKNYMEIRQAEQELIDKYGLEEYEKMNEKHEQLFEKFEEEFKRIKKK